jgi:hypothetical protein
MRKVVSHTFVTLYEYLGVVPAAAGLLVVGLVRRIPEPSRTSAT